MAPRWELLTRKTTLWLETWNFQPHSSFSRRRRGAGNEVNNWSCLHEEVSIKSQQYGKLPSGWTHLHTWRWCIPTPWGQNLLRSGLSQTSSYLFFHLYPLTYPLIKYKHVSLSSMSPSSKLIRSEERVMGTLDLQSVSQKHRWQPGLVIGIWNGVEQYRGTDPWHVGSSAITKWTVSELS